MLAVLDFHLYLGKSLAFFLLGLKYSSTPISPAMETVDIYENTKHK